MTWERVVENWQEEHWERRTPWTGSSNFRVLRRPEAGVRSSSSSGPRQQPPGNGGGGESGSRPSGPSGGDSSAGAGGTAGSGTSASTGGGGGGIDGAARTHGEEMISRRVVGGSDQNMLEVMRRAFFQDLEGRARWSCCPIRLRGHGTSGLRCLFLALERLASRSTGRSA